MSARLNAIERELDQHDAAQQQLEDAAAEIERHLPEARSGLEADEELWIAAIQAASTPEMDRLASRILWAVGTRRLTAAMADEWEGATDPAADQKAREIARSMTEEFNDDLGFDE